MNRTISIVGKIFFYFVCFCVFVGIIGVIVATCDYRLSKRQWEWHEQLNKGRT